MLKYLLAALVIFTSSAQAAQHREALGVEMPGTGSFKIGDAPDQSFSEFNFLSSNGISQYAVPTTSGSVGFAGKRDLQPSATDYLLHVDRIVNVQPDLKVNTVPADGVCKMKSDETGMWVYAVDCSVTTEFGPATLSFKGNGERVKITTVPLPKKH